jgi:hypothetical protein
MEIIDETDDHGARHYRRTDDGDARTDQAQTAKPKGSPKHRKLLYATLGALGGAGLGALRIVKLCPTGSDSPSACIAPPLAFVDGGACAGYKLGQKASQPTGPSAAPRTVGWRSESRVSAHLVRLVRSDRERPTAWIAICARPGEEMRIARRPATTATA